MELNLKRENVKWILLDEAPDYKPNIFSFMIHDFISEKKSLNGTASEICSTLKEKFPEQEFNCNWLYRDLLQHDDEIRALGIDYGKAKSNGARSIFIRYSSGRDSSGGKILCEENGVPAVPEIAANADYYLREVDCAELVLKENADPDVPKPVEIDDSNFSSEDAVSNDEAKVNAFIAMVAETMRRNLAAQGIVVPAFEPTKKQM